MKVRNLILILGGIVCISTSLWGVGRAIKTDRKMRDTIPPRMYNIGKELEGLEEESASGKLTKEQVREKMTNYQELMKELKNIYNSNPDVARAVDYIGDEEASSAIQGWGALGGLGLMAGSAGAYRTLRERREKIIQSDPYRVLRAGNDL